MSVAELLAGLVELGAHALLEMEPKSIVPGRGDLLRTTCAVELTGWDLRRTSEAEGFRVLLPRGTELRVETSTIGERLEAVATNDRFLALVPEQQRAAVTAYGYRLDIPPGSLASTFEIVRAST